VVYNGLLKKERKAIHERIGLVMEQLFKDRLPEFYETLSFHFSKAKSLHKAVDYLVKSGEKSLSKYAVQESHKYYKKAYNLITDKQTKTEEERELLFGLLNKWSLVYYYRGDFKEHTDLLRRHENEADLVSDIEMRGMYYGWLGFILQFRWELTDSYKYLQKALKLGEEAESQRVIGYACTWLAYTCAVMDKYEEGYSYWERAVPIAKTIESDTYLYFKSMGAIGHLNSFSGEKKQSFEIGNALLRYGEKYSNIRSQVVGHICIGHSYFADGDLEKAFLSYRKAVNVAEDPFYTQWPRAFVGLCCIMNDQINKAEEPLNEVSSYLQNYGCEIFGPAVMPFIGIVLINKGDMSKGLKTIEEIQEYCREKNWGWGIALSEYVLGNLYYQIAYGEKPGMSTVLKNLGFLAKNVPFASKKAENYFNRAIESAKQFGAKGILGQVYFDLGLLHKAKKRNNSAGKCISEAINIFEQIGAEVRLKQAKDALSSL
jgi:tetratricopeptide (TPR) repeat protein